MIRDDYTISCQEPFQNYMTCPYGSMSKTLTQPNIKPISIGVALIYKDAQILVGALVGGMRRRTIPACGVLTRVAL